MRLNNIVIITNSADPKRRDMLKTRHIAPNAMYHVLTPTNALPTVRGLTIAGIILDRIEFDALDKATQTALKSGCDTICATRGLRDYTDLITKVY